MLMPRPYRPPESAFSRPPLCRTHTARPSPPKPAMLMPPAVLQPLSTKKQASPEKRKTPRPNKRALSQTAAL